MVTFVLQNKQLQELSELMAILAMYLAGSADSECGFSLMSTLKTRLQNCLQLNNLDTPMHIKKIYISLMDYLSSAYLA